jgi:hypothetical protein
MKLNIFDLKKIDGKFLLGLIHQTVEEFPILKQIYTEEFLQEIVKDRYHFNNYLLWLLSSKEPYTKATWNEISKSLLLLVDSNGLVHFKHKLRSNPQLFFQSYQTELDYAAYYKGKGYLVELEPTISSGKNPEFKIESDGFRTYFEVKNIFWDEMQEMTALETQIQGALGKITEPYSFSIFYDPKLSINNISDLRRFVISSVRSFGKGERFPKQLFFMSNGRTLAKVVIYGKTNKLNYGYLAGLQRRQAFEVPSPEIIRKKIGKKATQLPENEANVIVIELGFFGIDEDIIIDTLYGDELHYIDGDLMKSGRRKNGLFQPQQSTRISAVILSHKKFDDDSSFLRSKAVFHNPFANKGLNSSFFEDDQVKQLLPVTDETSIKMVWNH